MLDVMGAISLTALFGLCCGVLIGSSPGGTAARLRLAAVAVLWFAGVGSLAALGLFSAAGAGTPAIGTAILVPIVLSLWAVRRSPALRAVALGTPLTALVAAHAGRVLGFFFLLLFAAGRLPPTFAMAAGWGDIVVAIAALPLVWAIHRRVNGWRTLTLAWNLFGFVDLVTAVTLGVGSASDSTRPQGSSSQARVRTPWGSCPGSSFRGCWFRSICSRTSQSSRSSPGNVPAYRAAGPLKSNRQSQALFERPWRNLGKSVRIRCPFSGGGTRWRRANVSA